MDPNAALQLCRRVTRLVLNEPDHNDTTQLAMELAEGFDALDQWISKGGFLPEGWEKKADIKNTL
jgi:hypothetical protein